MGGGDEISNILDRIARRIIERREKERRVELDRVGPDSPNGVYIYDREKNKWVLIRVEGEEYIPSENGFYIIYFDNTKCPACRVYDLAWYTYIELIGRELENVNYVIVLCDWFARNCRSEAASKTFKYFDIHASPTTLLLRVEKGKVVAEERIEGAKTIDYLASKIEEFIRKTKSRD